jgi:hypothetical protein
MRKHYSKSCSLRNLAALAADPRSNSGLRGALARSKLQVTGISAGRIDGCNRENQFTQERQTGHGVAGANAIGSIGSMRSFADRWIPLVRIRHAWPKERFDIKTQGKHNFQSQSTGGVRSYLFALPALARAASEAALRLV